MSILPTRRSAPAPFTPTPLESLFPLDRPARRPVRWEGRPGEPTPLWALFGSEPSYDWRPGMALAPEDGGAPANDAPAPAPEPAPREAAPVSGADTSAWPATADGAPPFPTFDPAADPFANAGSSIFPLDHVQGGHITPYTMEGLNDLAVQAYTAGEPGIYLTARHVLGIGPRHSVITSSARTDNRSGSAANRTMPMER